MNWAHVGVAQATEGVQVLGEATQLEGLMRVLERRGVREGALFNSLLRHRDSLTAGMPAGPLRCAAWASSTKIKASLYQIVLEPLWQHGPA